MLLITLHLTGPEHSRIDPAQLAGIVQAHSTPEDGLEHVRVRAGSGQADLVLFLLAERQTAAEAAAREVCRRVLAREPLLTGWALTPPALAGRPAP